MKSTRRTSAFKRFLMAFWCAVLSPAALAQTWSLQSSVEHAVAVAPEMRAMESEIIARTEELTQADAWPNPTIDVRADEKLGLEDGRGGYDFNQISVTQPLPLRRLMHQRAAADANLESARASRRYQLMQIETQTARAFHALQLASGRMRLAEERLKFSESLRSGNDRLVRYLAPMERTRLDILRETARQEMLQTEGKWSEAAAQFRTLLALAQDASFETVPLEPLETPLALAEWQQRLASHPALQSAQKTRDASRANVDVARASRLADPSVSVFRERDSFTGGRRDYTGVMLSLQVPLWNRNSGQVARAVAEADKAEISVQTQRRDLENRARQSHAHLEHLIEQVRHYRSEILEPARKLLDLTRKAFATGEQNGLALVDASNTYFDAQARYLELLHDAWVESAELRLAVGISLMYSPEAQP